MPVKSNYNFVPAPEEDQVYKPHWSDQVSHDIPFSDGESGEIKISITAKTPIFIRNGHSQQTGKKAKEIIKQWVKSGVKPDNVDDLEILDKYLSFSNIKNKNGEKEYSIPSSSLKGMLRNTLEIMSRSRIKMDNEIFSFRDIDHPTYKSEVSNRLWNNLIKKGWLKKVDGRWIIEECNAKRVDVRRMFRNHKYADLSAADKYKLMNGQNLNHTFSFERELTVGNRVTDHLYRIDDNGGRLRGKLVFFGGMESKKYEFVFTEPNGEEYNVPNDLMHRFLDIDAKLKDTQWQYYIENGDTEYPVFFYSSDGENVDHFGFSKLYKIPTRKLDEIQPLLSYRKRKSRYRLDLAECIFGTVADTNPRSGKFKNDTTLKGRVFTGIGKLKTKVKEHEVKNINVVLSSPKPSYYPFYVEDGETYLFENAEIRGFKKYPIHNTQKDSDLNAENKEIESIIRPLPAKTQFTSKIRFHNLNKIELGALLSAITLHGNEETLFHSIGSGKPLGYGKIKISIERLRFQNKKEANKNEYLAAFENEMEQFHKGWLNSIFMEELLAMAKTADPDYEHNLVYPTLEPNQFKAFKTEGLANYSSINGRFLSHSVQNFFSSQQKEEQDKKAQQAALIRQQEEPIDLKQALEKNTTEALQAFKNKYPDSTNMPQVDERLRSLKQDDKKAEAENFMNEKFPDDLTSFDGIKAWIKIKKQNPFFKLQDPQSKGIQKVLTDIFKEELGKKNKKKCLFFGKKNKFKAIKDHPWTDIKKWLDPEVVEKLFNNFKDQLS